MVKKMKNTDSEEELIESFKIIDRKGTELITRN